MSNSTTAEPLHVASRMLSPEGTGKGYCHGTHRLITPAETLARVRPHMSAMGITRLANITGLDRIGIPVVMACRPNSRALSVSQGKGLDLDAAKASALMESVESYHGEHINLPLRFTSYDELSQTDRVVNVRELAAVRDRIFNPHAAMLWVEGYDLLRSEALWVPLETVSTNYTVPYPPGSGFFQATSNGLASGNHLLEAISHGICEVVERDASTLWRLSPRETQDSRGLALDAVDDPACREALEQYEQAGVEAAVWEMTSDIGIPAFRCVIADRDVSQIHLTYNVRGMGCHPSRGVALLRALTEAAQSRLTFVAGSRDDIFREDYATVRNPETMERILLSLQAAPACCNFRDIPTWESPDLHADVVWELDRLREAGLQRVIVVELTRPEFQIPVVRVIIPGLEGISPQADYTPGARARTLLERAA